MNNAEKIPFSVDISRMIEVLAAQIYPSPFALLRENVQNSFDAILIRKFLGHQFEPRIDLTIEPGRIKVVDNGVGMSRDNLRTHFWKAGSSSKNTADARAAGVVGTFGIGAMANFGIAEELLVVSESSSNGERTRCRAQRSTLSVTENCIDFEPLPSLGAPGTEIIAEMQPGKTINVTEAVTYISSFVAYLPIDVSVNGALISRNPIEDAVPKLVETWRTKEVAAELSPGLKADVELTGAVNGEVRVDLCNLRVDDKPVEGRLILKQGLGNLRTFRSRFGLATANVSSLYGFGGVADFLFLQPTAGREALTTESLQALQRITTPIDQYVSLRMAQRPEANSSAPFVSWAANHGRWDLCGQLRVRVEPGETATLQEIADRSQSKPVLVYSGNDQATMEHASQDRPLVIVSRTAPRNGVELNYLRNRAKMEELTSDPQVLRRKQNSEYSMAESALSFRLSSILSTDYFLNVDFRFGKISHGLPLLVTKKTAPVEITLDQDGNTVKMMLEIYGREYIAFGHMAKDFVRNVVFPKVADLVPSATRQGAEAFLKSIQRNREIFEYEMDDLESLTKLWKDYLDGRVTLPDASALSATLSRSYQYIDSAAAGSVRDVVPDVVENEQATRDQGQPNLEATPSIQRLDIATERKLLVIDDSDPPLKGYRCFLALTDRVREEKGDFFLQPHKTSVVWGGQKALFIFEHQSGSFGLYYDLQIPTLIATQPGGGSFETCTIVMKNRLFIPIPEPLRTSFLPATGEKKRLEVRCDILYIDRT